MKNALKGNRSFSKMLALFTLLCVLAAGLPAAAMAEAEAVQGLKVGAGIADITPTQDMFPMGGGWPSGRGTAYIGAITRAYTRVIAMQNNDGPISLMVSVETGKGPYIPDMMQAISDATGVEKEYIFWSATHVHSIPEAKQSTWADGLNLEIRTDTVANNLADLCVRNKSRWCKLVQKRLVEAAREAIADMQPAEVGMAAGTSYINVNRDTQYRADPTTTAEGFNGAGPSDKTLTTLEFRNRETGAPIAFIVHHALHNTLMFSNDYFNPAFEGIHFTRNTKEIIEGDYDHDNVDDIVPGEPVELNVAYCDPYTYAKYEADEATGMLITDGEHAGTYRGIVGANVGAHCGIGGLVSQYVEYNNPGAVALWVSGAAGDQNPLLRSHIDYPAPFDVNVGTLKSFAEGTHAMLPIEGGLAEAAVYYAAIQYVDVKNTLSAISEYKSDMPISRAFGETVLPRDPNQPDSTGKAAQSYNISLTVMCLGDITFAGSNGELYNNIGVYMRDNSIAPNVLVVNHCWPIERDSDEGYYPDDVAISNNSYMWNRTRYALGTINPAMLNLLDETYQVAQAK